MSNSFNSILLAPFTPRQLPGLWGWWDGNDINGNGINPSNGSSLALIADKSGYGNNFTQVTGANQPTFSSNAKNGRGGILLTSTRTMSTINPPAGATFGNNARSLILVFALTTTIAGNNHLVWNQGGGGNGNNSAFGHFNAGGARLGIDSGGTGQYVTFDTTVITVNTFYVWEYYCASGVLTSSTSIITGTSQGATNHGYPGGNPGLVASSAITIGGASNVTLLELIACNVQLNTAQQKQVRYYVRGKWAI